MQSNDKTWFINKIIKDWSRNTGVNSTRFKTVIYIMYIRNFFINKYSHTKYLIYYKCDRTLLCPPGIGLGSGLSAEGSADGAGTGAGAGGAAGASGACAESELDVSAEAGRGGGEGRRAGAGAEAGAAAGGTATVDETTVTLYCKIPYKVPKP